MLTTKLASGIISTGGTGSPVRIQSANSQNAKIVVKMQANPYSNSQFDTEKAILSSNPDQFDSNLRTPDGKNNI